MARPVVVEACPWVGRLDALRAKKACDGNPQGVAPISEEKVHPLFRELVGGNGEAGVLSAQRPRDRFLESFVGFPEPRFCAKKRKRVVFELVVDRLHGCKRGAPDFTFFANLLGGRGPLKNGTDGNSDGGPPSH